MEQNQAHMDYYREFDQKQYSKNPFVQMAYHRQQQYMEGQKKRKKAQVKQRLLERESSSFNDTLCQNVKSNEMLNWLLK